MRTCSMFIMALLLVTAPLYGDQVLDYQYRYDCQSTGPDHIMDVLDLGDGRAIAAGNLGLALIDLDALPMAGTQDYLYWLQGINARNVYRYNENTFLVNQNRGESQSPPGFVVVELDGNSLTALTTITEDNVLYEKMCISGKHLYVAAHANGIRIFDLSDPAEPELVGSLTTGFTDAWAIDVAGSIAYVADGGGGLKIVDVSTPGNPRLISGETPDSALGTAEDVKVINGHVFVAAASGGLQVYPGGVLAARTCFKNGVAPKDLATNDTLLAVATMDGVDVYTLDGSGVPVFVASERSTRRGQFGVMNTQLRICSAVDVTADGRVLCANWNYMDVYRLNARSESTQPDITVSADRVRLPAAGGETQVILSNTGGAPLVVNDIMMMGMGFNFDYYGGTIEPGESVTINVSYAGWAAGEADPMGEDILMIESNDPDENPVPVQVYGSTDFLDPGETPPDFTMPVFRQDPVSGTFTEETFSLSAERGKIVWFQIYGSW